jgi:hypothetical protein
MGIRTFIVRVSETEPRVVVEDVRSRERLVAPDISAVGQAIKRLLETDAERRASRSLAEPPA